MLNAGNLILGLGWVNVGLAFVIFCLIFLTHRFATHSYISLHLTFLVVFNYSDELSRLIISHAFVGSCVICADYFESFVHD